MHEQAGEVATPGHERQRDALTKLLARGEFDPHLAAAIERAREADATLSFVFLDIDFFKKVNDTHGHARGDEALKGVARLLNGVSAHKGDAYRYGGEEFAVILENFDLQEALAVAERVRRETEASPIDGLDLTLSAGVATFPEHAEDSVQLFEAADKALLKAKDRGRNLVQFYGEAAPPIERRKRTTQRRQPMPRALTERQRREYRKIILRSGGADVPVCPRDGTPLEVRDATNSDSVGREYIIFCPDCGLREHLSGDS